MQLLKPFTSLALSSYLLYGAFSRLTHGVYTPSRYEYQIDRSPDDGSTLARIIPCMDILFGSMVLWPRTRRAGAAMVTIIMALGIYMRKLEGKDVLADCVVTLGVFVGWMVLGS
jgi:hypothetical protein